MQAAGPDVTVPRPGGTTRRARTYEVGDDRLIAQVRDGSGEAFEELWRRHAEAGHRVAARFTSASEPDDLVQEAYLRIYSALQNGNGPDLVFRPYLYQTIRNIAITWAGRPVEQPITTLDDVSDGSDMSSTVLENSVTATAFRSLPDRWQSVLWYSEVEGLEPAEIAPLLGIKAGAVSALAYRAREGFRRAWLQVHVNSEAVPPECTWAAERMGDHNRGALRGATKARFDEHVNGCIRCMALVDEVHEVSRKLGLVMVPIVVGVPWVAFTEVPDDVLVEGADALTGLVGGDFDGGLEGPAAVTPVKAPRSRLSRGAAVAVVSAALALVLAVLGVATMFNGLVSGPATIVASSAVASVAPYQPAGPPAPAQPDAPPAGPQPLPTDGPPAPAVGSSDEDLADRLFGYERTPDDASELAGPTVPTGPDSPPLPGTVEPPGSAPDPSGPTTEVDPIDPAVPNPAGPYKPDPSDPPIPDVPTLTGPDPSTALTVFPTMTGTAQPDIAVLLEDAAGRLLAQVVADPVGDWSATIGIDGAPSGADDPWADALTEQSTAHGLTITARAVDAEGRSSVASPPSDTYTFVGAQVLTPAAGSEVTYSATDHDRNGLLDDLDVEIGGLSGQGVLVYVDGATSGTVHQIGSSSLVLYSPGRALGVHTIGVQYVAPGRAAAGPVVSHTFTIVAAPARAASGPTSATDDEPESFQDLGAPSLPQVVIEPSPSRLQGQRGQGQRTGKARRPVRRSR